MNSFLCHLATVITKLCLKAIKRLTTLIVSHHISSGDQLACSRPRLGRRAAEATSSEFECDGFSRALKANKARDSRVSARSQRHTHTVTSYRAKLQTILYNT